MTRRIPLYWVLIIALIIAIPYNLYINHFNIPVAHSEEQKESCNLPYNLVQINRNTFVHPILLAEVATEDPKLNPLKEKINALIEEKKNDKTLTSASVYFNILNSADGWFGINNDQKYNLASLLKVAFVMAMLKDAEDNPAMLDKKIHFTKHLSAVEGQNILNHALQLGNYYTIKELLQYAICYSDNDAAYLIVEACKTGSLNKLLTDLQLPPCDLYKEYIANAEEYSRLFRVLCNGSYLSNDLSEYALELLTKSDFNEGITKKLDKNIIVARKFGERTQENKELHEFGIIYLKGNPYLLGIMTKGNDYKQLEELISTISTTVYEEMAKPAL